MEELPPENDKIERLRRAMYSRLLSTKIKERDRRTLEQPLENVSDDWKREEPKLSVTMVAPRQMNLARTLIWWILAIAVIFFIGAVGLFIYYFTVGGGSLGASAQNIDIVVSGPPQIAGGEASELQIAVTNRNRVPLELSDLIVTYPDGTRSVADYATPLPSLRQSLGTILPGATRQGTVTAVFSGQANDHADIKVELQYHVSGSNAVFTASTDYTFTFTSSPLSIAIDGNSQTISGQPMQLIVTVSSNAAAPIRDVLLSASYPFGFKLTSATPQPAGANLWQLGDFGPGDKKVITLLGVMKGEENDKRVFNFKGGTRSATSTTITTQLAVNPFTVVISQAFLSLNMSINNSASPVNYAKPGDTENLDIHYKNNLSTAIQNAVIVAKLSGVEIDGSTVTSDNGFYRSSDDTVLWDKTTTGGELASLAPGAEGNLHLSFKIPPADTIAHVSDPFIGISINAAGNRLSETGVPENLQSSVRSRIGIASALTLSANGLYYSSPYGSTGPMPPKANVETTYAMVLTITNTSNKISGAKVVATLPSYVRWTGKYSPPNEDIKFNQENSTVTWNVGDIAPDVGTSGVPPRQIGFEIGFTPSTSQIEQEPVLLQSIVLSGTDQSTGQNITSTAPNVTTNIIHDAGFNSSNATVVK
jgi:hypothetical protein